MASNDTPTTSNGKRRFDESERNAKKFRPDQSSPKKQSDFQQEVESRIAATSYLETGEIIALDQSKIITIVNCATTETFWGIMGSENFLKSFKESSQCFVLIVDELKFDFHECATFTDRFSTKELEGRPLILQIQNADQTLIFFKESESNKLSPLIENVSPSENVPNLSSMLRALGQRLPNKMIDLRAMLSSHKVVEKIILDNKLIEHVNDEITTRFLNIFGPRIENKMLSAAVENAPVGVLAALLELPISYKTRDFGISLNKQRQIELGDLMCISIDHQKTEILSLLVRLCSETLKPGMPNVSQCAADAKNYEHLVLLIRNDFPFPKELDNILLGCNCMDLKVICDERKKFIAALENNDVATAEIFIANNPGIKIGFGFSNEISLTIALQAAKKSQIFDMYSLLLYHRFVALGDIDHDISFAGLTEHEKYQISTACGKLYGRHVESHIFYIYSRTRIGFKNIESKQSEYFKKIKEYLDILNGIDIIAPILKVIENSESLNIVFDFDNESIHKLYVGRAGLSSSGYCDVETGQIYIGAKAPDNEVSATLAHELTHYVNQIMFDNDAMPFDKGDKKNKRIFKAIVVECKNTQAPYEPFDTVRKVFSLYDPWDYNCELIVRVNEITAQYQNEPDVIDTMTARYPKLFSFYQDHVLKTINAFIKDPKKFRHMRNVQGINFSFGNFGMARSFGISKVLPQSNLAPARIQFILCDVPQLGEASFVQTLQQNMPTREILSSYIFSSTSNFRNQYELRKFNEMETNDVTFVIRCEEGDERENHEALWKFISEQNGAKFVFICCSVQSEEIKKKLKLPDSQIEQTEVTHIWADLTDVRKNELLESEVLFQEVPLRLKQLVNSDSRSLLDLPLKGLFSKSKQFLIGQRVASSQGYDSKLFIERKFQEQVRKIQRDVNEPEKADLKWKNPISLASLLVQVEAQKFIALSDNAGMGKSTIISHIATELKEKFQDKLVLRVNLHNHADDFDCKDFNEILNILMQPKPGFEQKLFDELFNNRKVIFLFDGFDEIAPKSAESFLSFLINLKESPVSQVWITTRPHLTQNLEDKLGLVTYCLTPFNSEDQVNFMVGYWKKKLQIEDDFTAKLLEKCAKAVLTHLVKSIRKTVLDLMGIPLQTLMLSEIFTKEMQTHLNSEPGGSNSFNIDSLAASEFPNAMYRRFVTRKIEIVQSEKGAAVSSEKANLEERGKNILKVHEHYAVEEIFAIESNNVLGKDVLQRYGIITFTGDTATFIHRTFAEYFVARHVANNLQNLNFEILLAIILNPHDYELLIRMVQKEIEYNQNTQVNEFHKVIAASLDQAIEGNEAVHFLIHKLLRAGNSSVTDFFVECIKLCAKPTIKKLLTSCISHGDNVLIYSSRYWMLTRFPMIWDLVKLAYEDEVSSYFLAVDDDGLNAFQIMYLVSYKETEETQSRFISMLRRLYAKARECLDSEQLEHLIASCHHRPTVNNCGFWVICPAFQTALSFKFKIAREFMADKSAEEIFSGDNLFTFSIRFIIESNHRNMDFVVDLFSWAKREFSSDTYKKFCSKFLPLAEEHKKVDSELR